MTEQELKELPEAPESVTIRSYYKGYSVLLTKRHADVKALPLLESAMRAIDWMEANGFKPSWDVVVPANEIKTVPGATVASTAPSTAPICGVHNIPMSCKSGTSKTTGHPYAFWGCSLKSQDGNWCNFKPVVVKQEGEPAPF